MIHLVVALHAEAKPLIQRYRLKGHSARLPFRLYENEHMRLVISGIGKMRAAAATAFLFCFGNYQYDVTWINFGIAGHAKLPLGTLVLAHKIHDQASNETWYPCIIFDVMGNSVVLQTHDQACLHYPHEQAVDMEAAGFYSTAIKFTTSEIVHCIKIISDNEKHDSSQITAANTAAMIAAALDEIDNLVQRIALIGEQLNRIDQDPPLFRECADQWHFSVYETNQLRQLLQRVRLLAPQLNLGPYLSEKNNAQQIIAALNEVVAAQLAEQHQPAQ